MTADQLPIHPNKRRGAPVRKMLPRSDVARIIGVPMTNGDDEGDGGGNPEWILPDPPDEIPASGDGGDPEDLGSTPDESWQGDDGPDWVSQADEED
jgi:hypothetical protein